MTAAEIRNFLKALEPHFQGGDEYRRVKPSFFLDGENLVLRLPKGGRLWDVHLSDDEALDENTVKNIVSLVATNEKTTPKP